MKRDYLRICPLERGAEQTVALKTSLCSFPAEHRHPLNTLHNQIRTWAKTQGFLVVLSSRAQLLISVVGVLLAPASISPKSTGTRGPRPYKPDMLCRYCYPAAFLGACGLTYKLVSIFPNSTTYCSPACPFFKSYIVYPIAARSHWL